jgi:hypothetical protein
MDLLQYNLVAGATVVVFVTAVACIQTVAGILAVAPLKIITYRAIKTTGTLIVIMYLFLYMARDVMILIRAKYQLRWPLEGAGP